MRLILYLITSLTVAVTILAVLIMTDVLQFGANGALVEGTPSQKTGTVIINDAPDSMKTDDQHGVAELEAAEYRSPDSVAGDLVIETHEKALSFLSTHTSASGSDIEDLFKDFLLKECNVGQDMAARLVRMSFWKNFVTLQDTWEPGESETMRAAFAREKALKGAGFAAQGLTLMRSEVEAAEEALTRREVQLETKASEEHE